MSDDLVKRLRDHSKQSPQLHPELQDDILDAASRIEALNQALDIAMRALDKIVGISDHGLANVQAKFGAPKFTKPGGAS